MMKQSAEKTTSKNAVKTVIPSIWRTAGGKYSLIMLAIWLVVSAISLVWTPYSLLDTDGFNTWASPSGAHMLGTDGVGADVLSWLMAGSRTNLAIALLTVVVAAAIGLLLVAAMVSRHGALASTSVVVVDALISIPTVLIALMLSVPFGASAAVIIAACGLAYGAEFWRVFYAPRPCSPHVLTMWNRLCGRVRVRYACFSRILCRIRFRCYAFSCR